MSDAITCTIHDAPLDACACPRDWLGYRAKLIAATAEIATLRAELAKATDAARFLDVGLDELLATVTSLYNTRVAALAEMMVRGAELADARAEADRLRAGALAGHGALTVLRGACGENYTSVERAAEAVVSELDRTRAAGEAASAELARRDADHARALAAARREGLRVELAHEQDLRSDALRERNEAIETARLAEAANKIMQAEIVKRDAAGQTVGALLAAAYDAAWDATGEGFNGEYTRPSFTPERYAAMRDEAIAKILAGGAP